MKHIPALIFFLALTACEMSPAAESLRQRLNLNRDWKFQLGDPPGAGAVAYDDSQWTRIGLPHSFSIPYFQGKDFYTGYGWYRKTLEIAPGWMSQRVFVEFDGAFQDAEVFVNGQAVGRHRGGYTGFSFEITPAMHAGRNVLAVRLNNNWSPTLAPRGGDYIFPGGIYRDVWLVVVNPLHVTWYGTCVTTPEVSRESAGIRVQTEVQNQGAAARDLVLTTEILGPGGRPVARFSSPQTIPAGATVTVDQTGPAIPNPKLWHPAHPFMYTAVTTLSAAGTAVDEYRTPFGIRWFKWTADQGFFLNGEHYYFHGANAHQDHAGWANAVTDAGAYRDVQWLKDAGFDFIRGSHYPHHPAFSDACDRLGVLFWSENCFWMGGGAHQDGSWMADAYPIHPEQEAAFEQSVEDTLRDEIRILRNHPSIVVWSMCNEVFFSSNQPKVKKLLSRMVELTHQLDPTRPSAIGGAQRGGLDKLGDVAGYNGDGARLFINPGIPNVVTEYGAQPTPQPGTYDGHFKARDGLVANTPEYPWRGGQVIWCGFDYGTIFGSGVSKGLLDYARIPKREWYWYRNEYLHIPPPDWPSAGVPARLALTADKRVIVGTDARDDVQLLVAVEDGAGKPINNSPPVTFTIASGPGEFPTGRSITFDGDTDIPIRDGKAAIEFRSYYGGQTVIRATAKGLKDSLLKITTQGEPRYVAGSTLVTADRPYRRFVRPADLPVAEGGDIARNRPTWASSEAAGHNGAEALDGDPFTYWSASDNQPGAWWQVNMEQPHTIDLVRTTFPTAGNYRYRIDGSSDGSLWTLLIDQTKTASVEPTRTDLIPAGRHCQFVRITFTALPAGQPAAIANIFIQGKHWP